MRPRTAYRSAPLAPTARARLHALRNRQNSPVHACTLFGTARTRLCTLARSPEPPELAHNLTLWYLNRWCSRYPRNPRHRPAWINPHLFVPAHRSSNCAAMISRIVGILQLRIGCVSFDRLFGKRCMMISRSCALVSNTKAYHHRRSILWARIQSFPMTSPATTIILYRLVCLSSFSPLT